MSDTTFAFEVDEELKVRFAEAAAARATTSEDLLREFMNETVHSVADGYDAWFRKEIEQALREADDPDTKWISNDDIWAKWDKVRASVTRADSD